MGKRGTREKRDGNRWRQRWKVFRETGWETGRNPAKGQTGRKGVKGTATGRPRDRKGGRWDRDKILKRRVGTERLRTVRTGR